MSVEQRLSEIEARAQAATPGPWVVEDFDDRTQAVSAPTTREYWVCIIDNAGPAAAEFIAHSRADVEWLVAQVRGLYAIVKDLADEDPLALNDDRDVVCPLCRTTAWEGDVPPFKHLASCPWRRAVEAMEAQ